MWFHIWERSEFRKISWPWGEVLLDKESNEDIYDDVHVFKPKFNSISEVYEELKDKKLNLDKTIDCAAPHYMSNILGNPVVEVLYSGSEIYIHYWMK